MLVFTTGISGCDEKEYLKQFRDFSAERGKRVKIYDIGEMMFEHASRIGILITKKNVLNTNPHILNSLRGAVIEKILANLEEDKKKYDVTVLGMHAMFFWKKIFIRAFDQYSLDRINPDMFLTFIDNSVKIKKRLDEREQWKDQKLEENEIMLWQNVEVEMTGVFAQMQKKPFFVLPIGHDSEILYKLIFHPNMEPVYISMPMTHQASATDKERVTKFAKELNKYYTVFDPRTIEISAREDEDRTVYYQTINRDLYWLIRQSKKVIGFFPSIILSTGVINELREGYETNKEVWLIFPSNHRSPFTDYFTTKIFENERQFFDFVKKDLKAKYNVPIN